MNLSISPGKNNVGAYINDINLKSLNQEQATEIKKILNQYGVIFINCLLYTSPSPRDISGSRMPSSA